MVPKIYKDLTALENYNFCYQLFSTFAQHFTCNLQSASYTATWLSLSGCDWDQAYLSQSAVMRAYSNFSILAYNKTV